MRNIIKLPLFALMLFSTISSSSCASSSIASPPRLELRGLRISPDVPGLEYQWEECVSTFLGFCTKHEMRKDIYDLRDETVRKQLIDMNFVARVREKI